MIEPERFSWKKRSRAFVYAWQGLKALVKYEHNARIHVVAAVIAIILSILLGISMLEWCLILLCIGMVISAEALNSGIEAIADKVSPEHDLLIGRAKDFGAAAVVVLALIAVCIGGIIFIPKIYSILFLKTV